MITGSESFGVTTVNFLIKQVGSHNIHNLFFLAQCVTGPDVTSVAASNEVREIIIIIVEDKISKSAMKTE